MWSERSLWRCEKPVTSSPAEPPSETPWGSRDDLRRYALDEQRMHDPVKQAHGYDRCEYCHYTRHPCSVHDLATAVLWLMDEGRTDV